MTEKRGSDNSFLDLCDRQRSKPKWAESIESYKDAYFPIALTLSPTYAMSIMLGWLHWRRMAFFKGSHLAGGVIGVCPTETRPECASAGTLYAVMGLA
jgi:hypothetical protein